MSASQEPPNAEGFWSGQPLPDGGVPPAGPPPPLEPGRPEWKHFEDRIAEIKRAAEEIARLGGLFPKSDHVTEEAIDLALRAVQNGLSDTDVKDTAFCQANVLAPFLNQIETFRRSCFERLKQIEEPTSDHVERIFLSEKLGLGKDQSRRVRKESAQELAQLCKQFVDEIFRFLKPPFGKLPNEIRREQFTFAELDLLDHVWRCKHRKINCWLALAEVGAMVLFAVQGFLWSTQPVLAAVMLLGGAVAAFFTVYYFRLAKKL
jgi:hypothetical protein